MPNGHDHNKEYGSHRYDRGDMGDCICGCRMGGFSSSGPIGLDPFGACPSNPKDGKLLGGSNDYELVVNQRIEQLARRAHQAETRFRGVEPGAKKLANELRRVQAKLFKREETIKKINEVLHPRPSIFTRRPKSTAKAK